MMPGNLVLWHSSKRLLGSWVIRTPNCLVQQLLKSLDLILHTWTQGVFHYWQLLTETADGLLPSPLLDGFILGQDLPAQNSSDSINSNFISGVKQ